MTAIIGIETNKFSSICSDRMCTRGTRKTIIPYNKIFSKKDVYMGFSGYSSIHHKIQYNWEVPDRLKNQTVNEYIFRIINSLKKYALEYDTQNQNDKIFDDFEYIMSYNGSLFEFDNHFVRCDLIKNISVIGCVDSLIYGILLSETENKNIKELTEDQ